MALVGELVLSVCGALLCVAIGLYTFFGWLFIFYMLGVPSIYGSAFACAAVAVVIGGGAVAIHRLFELFDELDY